MKKFLKNSEGFTLVELMVVVAIIGILSAIAVPNFKKYQAKSKQSEAKLQLAALYSAEVGANADYDTYATCIRDIGYEAQPKGYYIVGFNAHNAPSAAVINARTAPVVTCTAANFALVPTIQHTVVDAAAPTAAALIGTVAPTASVFTAVAAGDISNGGAAYDRWTMNEAKTVINTAVGF